MRSNLRHPLSPKRRILAAAVCVLVSGCTSSIVNYEARTHIVQPGETLYEIAWRYGLDHQDVARLNGLANPDLIFVGQRLALRGGPAASAGATGRASAPPPLPSRPMLPPPMWQWPVEGQLVRRFGGDTGLVNGIGIAGSEGEKILAAASGRVVYAGSGLIGYGQLVIIKHNDTFLSAYGYNRRLLVRQGDAVELGQAIAEMGTGPERRPELHFEIRRNGMPEDPLRHLPR